MISKVMLYGTIVDISLFVCKKCSHNPTLNTPIDCSKLSLNLILCKSNLGSTLGCVNMALFQDVYLRTNLTMYLPTYGLMY